MHGVVCSGAGDEGWRRIERYRRRGVIVVMTCRVEYEPTWRRSPVSTVLMVIFTSAPDAGGSGLSRNRERTQ